MKERGGSEVVVILGVLAAFAICYYAVIFGLDFMREVKYERKVARGLVHERPYTSGEDAEYFSDLY